MGTEEPRKETKKMSEDENDNQVRTISGGPLKKKEMPRYEQGKWVRTYAEFFLQGGLVTREKSKYFQ